MLDNLNMTEWQSWLVVACLDCMSCERFERRKLSRRSMVAKLAALNRWSCECWVRGGVTQIIRRDDVMTRPWVCCCCFSGSLVARCRTAPVQQIVPTLAPPSTGNVGGRHVSDVLQCPSSLKMPTKSLHTLRIGKVKTFEAGCLTSKWDACLHTASDFHWHAVLI